MEQIKSHFSLGERWSDAKHSELSLGRVGKGSQMETEMHTPREGRARRKEVQQPLSDIRRFFLQTGTRQTSVVPSPHSPCPGNGGADGSMLRRKTTEVSLSLLSLSLSLS